MWDGTPPTPELIEKGASFAAAASRRGDVCVHCAHGRGRSTTLCVAALVRAGRHKTWEEALVACKEHRPCVKLNSKMRKALNEWQLQFGNRA